MAKDLFGVLQEHWLFSIACHHDAKTDQAVCACGLKSPERENVGKAVQDWIEHIRAMAGLIPEVTMQEIADVGLNVFGLQLFVKSVAGKNDARTFDPFSFIYKGIKVTMEPIRDVDTRH